MLCLCSTDSLALETRRAKNPRAKQVGKDGDKTPNTMSYIDFLVWIHKKIQGKFV